MARMCFQGRDFRFICMSIRFFKIGMSLRIICIRPVTAGKSVHDSVTHGHDAPSVFVHLAVLDERADHKIVLKQKPTGL